MIKLKTDKKITKPRYDVNWDQMCTQIKRCFYGILYHLPHKAVHTFIYIRNHKHRINWSNPTSYDEKIHWLMVNMYNSSYNKFVDKYQVRQYVKECGLGDLLIPLFGVFKNAEEINYDALPDKFILKTTQGSGKDFYEICKDKKGLNTDAVNRKMNRALQTDFFKFQCEYQYEEIAPQIICEKLLECEGRERLDDYKVACTNGKAEAILLCTCRDKGLDYYSRDWKYLNYVKKKYRSGEKKTRPDRLEEMIRAAEILSKPFPMARIDFYIIDHKLYFGEITLSPAGGNHKDLNELGQRELGKGMHFGREMLKE